jgi:hypothetical protein
MNVVTIYGTQDPVSSTQLTYYSSTATNIVPHPTLDVALVQLKQCGTTLPNSATSDKPALAIGPDGKLHAVAVFGDGSVGHWISDNGKSWSFKNKISGVSTDTTPALTTELGTQTGHPRKLGLAYKNKSDSVLRYARWSATGGWAAPIAIPTGLAIKGGLSGHNGIIAFAGNDDRAGVTAYDALTNTFIAVQWAPAAAPRVGIGKNVTVINDPVAQLSLLGWRADDNRWVQAYGTWSCLFGPTESYICANDPPYPTDWLQASLAYVSGDRIYLETMRPHRPSRDTSGARSTARPATTGAGRTTSSGTRP